MEGSTQDWPGADWCVTSFFLTLIVRTNLSHALENLFTLSCISGSEPALSAVLSKENVGLLGWTCFFLFPVWLKDWATIGPASTTRRLGYCWAYQCDEKTGLLLGLPVRQDWTTTAPTCMSTKDWTCFQRSVKYTNTYCDVGKCFYRSASNVMETWCKPTIWRLGNVH